MPERHPLAGILSRAERATILRDAAHTLMDTSTPKGRRRIAEILDAADVLEGTACRTPECDGSPDDGEGWDGFCGNCADRIAQLECKRVQQRERENPRV